MSLYVPTDLVWTLIPMAEEWHLKCFQCGFESHRVYVNTYRIGQAEVEVIEKGTITRFPDGNEVIAWTETGAAYEEQLANARALGYGDDVDQMNRDHDLCHNLLAQALGDPYCPVLYGVATKKYVEAPLYKQREAIVFLMQKLMHAGIEETARYVDEISRESA